MKRVCWLLLCVTILCGCSGENRELTEAMKFREALLSAEGCSFQAEVTADYGDSLTQFSVSCTGNKAGDLTFEILKPQSIAGIRGSISPEGGSIAYGDQSLYFPLLTEDLLSPASAPWIFLKTLRSGYLTSACREDDLLQITLDDSYAEDALTVDIWLEEKKPVRADILHDGKRILSLNVEGFVFS